MGEGKVTTRGARLNSVGERKEGGRVGGGSDCGLIGEDVERQPDMIPSVYHTQSIPPFLSSSRPPSLTRQGSEHGRGQIVLLPLVRLVQVLLGDKHNGEDDK